MRQGCGDGGFLTPAITIGMLILGKTVLALGAGVGELAAASHLRKKLPREHRVVLVNREADNVFTPSFLRLMTGSRRFGSVGAALAKDMSVRVHLLGDGVVNLESLLSELMECGLRIRARGMVLDGCGFQEGVAGLGQRQ